MIIFTFIVSVLYWFLWAGVEAFVFEEISFIKAIFSFTDHTFWTRLPTVVSLMAIGVYSTIANTKRKEIEDELNKNYDLIPSFLDKIGSLVIAFNCTGKIVRFNSTCEKVTGYTFAEVRGKYFWRMFLKEKNAKTAQGDLLDLMVGQFPKGYEDHWICKDGTNRLIKRSNTVVFDKKGLAKYVISVGVDITAHQKAEEVLKKTEEGYKSIIDNINIGVSLVSPNREILYMNRQMKSWFSSPDFVESSICHDIVSNSSKESCLSCPTCKALSEKKVQEDIIKIPYKDVLAAYKVVSFPVENNEGKIIAVIETFEDFSRVDKQEQEIRHSYLAQAAINSLLRFSLESISLEGFLKCALNIILSSPLFSSLGMGAILLVDSEPQVLSMKVHTRFSEDLQKKYRRVPFGMDVCGRAASLGDFQFDNGLKEDLIDKQKGIRTWAQYCSPIIYAGNIVGVIVVCMEKGSKQGKKEEDFLNTIAATLAGVIQRKWDEQRLSQVNQCLLHLGANPADNIQRLVVLCGNILGAKSAFYHRISIKDNSYRSIGQYNPPSNYMAMEKYSGSLCEEVVGEKKTGSLIVYDLPHSSYINKDPFCSLYQFRTFIGKAIQCRSKNIGVLCGVYKDEPVLGSEDRKFLGIIASVIGVEEERIKANEELSHALTKLKEVQYGLIQSEKLAALGRFSSGIAHEVKNPLGIILGGTEYLERKLQTKNEDIKIALKKIKESTLRADTIVCDLVKFAMPSEIKTEKITPQELINETFSLLKYRSSLVNVEMAAEFAKEIIYIDIDKNQMQQVFFNVFVNAIDAMPKGGDIKVKTYKASGEEFSISGRVCVIEVVDTGEGIAKENLTRLFEPFFTTKRDKKGTGLGLAMSKTIVENNHGVLFIDSELNKGATVKIVLPILKV